MRTKRAKEHEAREGDDSGVPGVHDIATIDLEEATLETWTSERRVR